MLDGLSNMQKLAVTAIAGAAAYYFAPKYKAFAALGALVGVGYYAGAHAALGIGGHQAMAGGTTIKPIVMATSFQDTSP